MHSITYETLVPRLLERVPEFHPTEEWVEDNLAYLVFGDLMRFINLQLEDPANDAVVRRIFEFFESALNVPDPRIKDVLDDSFHDLAVSVEPVSVKRFMKRATRRLYESVEDSIYVTPFLKKAARFIRFR